jgi:hypothetical protein
MATVAARHLDLIAVAWGKATTFVVGAARTNVRLDVRQPSEAPKRWETISCKSIFPKKPLRRLSKVDACVEHLVKAGMIRR